VKRPQDALLRCVSVAPLRGRVVDFVIERRLHEGDLGTCMADSLTQSAPLALSVVVPVFNGEAFIANTMGELINYLAAWPGHAELIVVDDGSVDRTPEILERLAAGARIVVHVVRNRRNLGKGAAIVRGMQRARGAQRLFLDADLAYGPEQIVPICAALSAGADLAIANRVHRGSRLLISPSFLRYIYVRYEIGRFLNWLVRLLLLPGVRDSQAGLKGFTADAAEQLFAGWLPRGFSFDVALLFRSRRLGLCIEQVPVLYRLLSEPSTVRFARDTTHVLRDLVQIRMRLVSGRFEQWNTVLMSWRQRLARSINTGRESVLTPPVLVAALGLCVLLLIVARLKLESGTLAVLAWLGSLIVVLLAAWRFDAPEAPRSHPLFHTRRERLLAAAIFVLCIVLRFVWLGQLPPMIHGDSAECGLLGLDLLNGNVPDVFNFSLWYDTPYLSFLPYAWSFALSGISLVGLRLPSAVFGVATIVPLYFLVRGWFGVRTAAFVATLYAISHSAIHFGRIGLWNIQVLFYTVSGLALLSRGWRRGTLLSISAAGVLSGVALYSYTGGRLLPLVAVAFLLAQRAQTSWPRVLRAVAAYATGLLVAAAPLALNYVKDPSVLTLDRTTSVWVLAEVNRAHVESTLGTTSTTGILWEQVKRTIAGFVTFGDASTQYGTDQPLLSPVTAVLCLLGLGVALWHWRETRYQLLLLWLSLGLVLGSVVVIDPPSYTRLIVVFPVPYILLAIGILWILSLLRDVIPFPRASALALYVLVLAQAVAFNLTGYYQFTRRMALMSREWDVLRVVEQSGARYDYYLYTGPFLLADSPIFQLFSVGTRAVNGFSEADLPRWLVRDSTFVLTPEFRRIGVAISERFPGVEREVIDQQGIRQLLVYRCTAANGCRRVRS
jgi:dolichyl-phosphate beta-glucosyltransferase